MTTSPKTQPSVAESAPLLPLGNSVLQSQTLETVATAENYHEWLCSLALPYLGDHPIELGSGLGAYADIWLSRGVPEITITEIDPARSEFLTDRFRDRPNVHFRSFDILDPPQTPKYSAYVAFNVLEHIEDDVQALRAAHSLVRPGGAVVMLVPAFQFAMSRFDRQVGHVRRYTKASLSAAMRAAGLGVEQVHYVNLPGLPAWFFGMRVFRMTPGDGPLLNIWDRQVIPTARKLEARRPPPFGQSVFAVARVPG